MNITTTRRAVLAGAASLPVLSAPALPAAAPTDPIFAAIVNYRAALTRCDETCAEASRLSEHLGKIADERAEQRMLSRVKFQTENTDYTFATTQEEHRRTLRYQERRKLDETPEAIRLEWLETIAGHETTLAARALVHMVPTTVAGALAVLEFIRERQDEGDDFLECDANEHRETDLHPVLHASLMAFLRSTEGKSS